MVIDAWSPIHLRAKLKELYWKPGKPTVGAVAFWDDSTKYLYLPRLKSREVLASVVRVGAASKDFFGTAYGHAEGKFDGFAFGDGNISFNDTLLLIEPEAATQYAIEQKKLTAAMPPESSGGKADETTPGSGGPTAVVDSGKKSGVAGTSSAPKAKSFRGTVEVSASLAKSKLNTIAEEVIKLLDSDPNANIRVTLEIDAEFPEGAGDTIKRAVSENAANLGFKVRDWE